MHFSACKRRDLSQMLQPNATADARSRFSVCTRYFDRSVATSSPVAIESVGPLDARSPRLSDATSNPTWWIQRTAGGWSSSKGVSRQRVADTGPTKGRRHEMQPWGVWYVYMYWGRHMADTATATAFWRGANTRPTTEKKLICTECRHIDTNINIYIYTNKRDIDIRRIYVSTPPCYRSACSPAAAFVSSPLSPQRSTCLKPAHLIQTLRNVFCETQFCNYE